MSRVAYILLNAFINILGFRFIYYPALAAAFVTLQQDPNTRELIQFLSTTSLYGPIIQNLSTAAAPTFIITVIKFLFFIPLRIIDIKRVKDIYGRELSFTEIAVIAIILSLPYVDFFSTIALSIIPPNKYAKK